MSENAGNGLRLPGLGELVVKSALVHTATYFLVGLAAASAFDYAAAFETGALAGMMRPVSDPMVAAGPLFQPIRGALFGLAFFLVRAPLFAHGRGWLTTWALLVLLSIVNPFGPAPASIEGLIYLRLGWSEQIGGGVLEVVTQALLLALGVHFWVRRPGDRWFAWGFGLVAGLAVLASLAGIFIPR